MRFLRPATKYGLYLFVFVLPWQTRYIFQEGTIGDAVWEYGTFSVYGTEVLLIALLILGLLTHLKDFDEEAHYAKRKALTIYIALFVFGMLGVGSIFFAKNVPLAILGAVRLVEMIGLIFLLVHSKYSVHRLGQWFVAAGVLQALIGTYQFLTQRIFPSTFLGIAEKFPELVGASIIHTESERILRAYGSLPHPNVLAGFLFISLIICMALLFTYRTNRERYLLYGASAILSIGLFYTFSRSAILAISIALLIILIYLVKNKNIGLLRRYTEFVVILFAAGAILGSAHSDVVLVRYLNGEMLETPSVTERIDDAQAARDIITAEWQHGVGIQNYTVALQERYPEREAYQYQPAHNVYMLILAELGIAGLFVFLYLLYEILKSIFNFRIEYNRELLEELEKFQTHDVYEQEYGYTTHWYVCLCGLLIGILAWAFFDHYFWTLYVGGLMTALVVGIWIKQYVRLKD